MDQLKLAVGYVRYSSKNQSELSIVAQKNKIEAFALKNGYTILRYYEDVYVIIDQTEKIL